MKVIFSRKGFDDTYGCKPSIILPQDRGYDFISFPIPEIGKDKIGFKSSDLIFDIKGDKNSLSDLFSQLNISNVINKYSDKFHYDPCIQKKIKGQLDYGAFGQSDIATRVLLNDKNKIEVGDLFLFFGTFQFTHLEENKLKYDKYTYPFHAIWGYLYVDDIIHISPEDDEISQDILDKYPSLDKHLHFINRKEEGKDNIIICGKRFGTFKYDEKYVLTKPGYKKSYWKLPDCFKNSYMKYYGFIDKPSDLKTAAKGQEFVVTDIKDVSGLNTWINSLLQ